MIRCGVSRGSLSQSSWSISIGALRRFYTRSRTNFEEMKENFKGARAGLAGSVKGLNELGSSLDVLEHNIVEINKKMGERKTEFESMNSSVSDFQRTMNRGMYDSQRSYFRLDVVDLTRYVNEVVRVKNWSLIHVQGEGSKGIEYPINSYTRSIKGTEFSLVSPSPTDPSSRLLLSIPPDPKEEVVTLEGKSVKIQDITVNGVLLKQYLEDIDPFDGGIRFQNHIALTNRMGALKTRLHPLLQLLEPLLRYIPEEFNLPHPSSLAKYRISKCIVTHKDITLEYDWVAPYLLKIFRRKGCWEYKEPVVLGAKEPSVDIQTVGIHHRNARLPALDRRIRVQMWKIGMVILGGSVGAYKLNEWMKEQKKEWPNRDNKITVESVVPSYRSEALQETERLFRKVSNERARVQLKCMQSLSSNHWASWVSKGPVHRRRVEILQTLCEELETHLSSAAGVKFVDFFPTPEVIRELQHAYAEQKDKEDDAFYQYLQRERAFLSLRVASS